MKKYMLDMKVIDNQRLHTNYCLLKVTSADPLPEIFPGQFVNILVEGSSTTFLRRPISVNFVDKETNELWLLIQLIGDGTRKLATLLPGDNMNIMLPLGNGFTMPEGVQKDQRILLVGGGVGTAPLLYLGYFLKNAGFTPTFLLGARSATDLMQLEEFARYGEVYTTTEDGTMGERGYVVSHSIIEKIRFDKIYTCGPKPMMQAVASYAEKESIYCEVSLENTMACGIGACLCCVEKTKNGHVCVCTEGPVFNIKNLTWLH